VRGFLARRLTEGVAVVFIAVLITFALIRLAPGNPFAAALQSANVPPSVAIEWSARYGFDRPIPEQFLRYIGNSVRGDFGYSTSQGRPVRAVIADALPNTLLLMGVAIAGSFLLGIAIGAVQALRRGRAIDHILSGITLFFYSIPDFWFALVILLTFTYWFPLFPSGGMINPLEYPGLGGAARIVHRLHHLVLPATTLIVLTAAVVARYQRSALLDVIHEDFIRTARSKGVADRTIIARHALRNALLPVITLFGLAFPALLGGAVFVESVFDWPGMGSLAVSAIGTRDYHLVTGVVIVGSTMVVIGNLFADLLYAAADPRLRRG
jgi:peptide/nickel transport system permease protein